MGYFPCFSKTCSRATQYYIEFVHLTFMFIISIRILSVCTSVGLLRAFCIPLRYWSKEVVYAVIGPLVSFMQFIKHWIWGHCNIIWSIRGHSRYSIFVRFVAKTCASVDLFIDIHIGLDYLVSWGNAIWCLFSPKIWNKMFYNLLNNQRYFI